MGVFFCSHPLSLPTPAACHQVWGCHPRLSLSGPPGLGSAMCGPPVAPALVLAGAFCIVEKCIYQPPGNGKPVLVAVRASGASNCPYMYREGADLCCGSLQRNCQCAAAA